MSSPDGATVRRPDGPDIAASSIVERKPGRTTRYFFFALGVTVYAFAVSLIGWREVGDALVGADLRYVGAAAAFTGIGAAMRIWKWRRALGAKRNAIGLYFLSRSLGVWSPARIGEFLPLAWRRHRNTRVAGWILFDRVLEVLVMLVIGLAGLAMIGLVPTATFVAICAVAAIVSVAGVYTLTRAELLRALAARFDPGTRSHAILLALAGTSGELRSYLGSSFDLIVVTVVAKSIDLYAITLIFRGLKAPAEFALVAASKCALSIVSYVPITPMATGIPHTVQGWIMHESAGIPPEAVAASVGIEAAIMAAVFSVTALAGSRAIRDAAL